MVAQVFNLCPVSSVLELKNVQFRRRFTQMAIVRSWREQKVMLKWRFPWLDEADFAFEDGKKEDMLIKLAARLRKTRAELELLFAELQKY